MGHREIPVFSLLTGFGNNNRLRSAVYNKNRKEPLYTVRGAGEHHSCKARTACWQTNLPTVSPTLTTDLRPTNC